MKQDNRKKGKILLALATTGAITLSMLAATVDAFANPKQSGFIGDKKAKEIALTHAKLKEKDVTFVRTSLEREDGSYEYDVKFYKGNKEYDYDIDAKTGKILDFDSEIEGFVIPGKQKENAQAPVSIEKAKELALKHAGLSAKQVKFVKVKQDRENGRNVYEIEFYHGKIEYDYEIDAKTGKILNFDFEIEGRKNLENKGKKPAPEQTKQNAGLTMEQVKEIALKHAGLTAKQVHFSKAKMDKDDGRWIYELEFYGSGGEYDFEIDAKSGKILSYDYEVKRAKQQEQPNASAPEIRDFDDDRDDDSDDFDDDDQEWDD